jgi:hypothetical protein
MDHAQPLILAKHIRSQQLREEAPQILLYLKFFCKTMLPHQRCPRPETPKKRRASSFLKLDPLQNQGIINLQDHGYNDKNSSVTPK